MAEGCPRPFDATNMAKGLADRRALLLAPMTLPVLVLQGRHNPGQHPEEYAHSPSVVADGRVQFIDGDRFLQGRAPDATAEGMRAFRTEPAT